MTIGRRRGHSWKNALRYSLADDFELDVLEMNIEEHRAAASAVAPAPTLMRWADLDLYAPIAGAPSAPERAHPQRGGGRRLVCPLVKVPNEIRPLEAGAKVPAFGLCTLQVWDIGLNDSPTIGSRANCAFEGGRRLHFRQSGSP
jgi:hypothetical protein